MMIEMNKSMWTIQEFCIQLSKLARRLYDVNEENVYEEEAATVIMQDNDDFSVINECTNTKRKLVEIVQEIEDENFQ